MSEKDLNDRASVKSACRSITGDPNNAYARRNSILERTPPPLQKRSRSASRQPPSTPPSRASSVAGKSKLVSPKNGWVHHIEDDSRSTHSLQSERAPRRQSLPGSSIRDDESLVSTPAMPSYMASTESARAKSRFQSPSDSVETPEKGSMRSAMKRLSFAEADKCSVSSPGGARRHSGPPKVNIASSKDVGVVGSEQDMSNGASREPV